MNKLNKLMFIHYCFQNNNIELKNFWKVSNLHHNYFRKIKDGFKKIKHKIILLIFKNFIVKTFQTKYIRKKWAKNFKWQSKLSRGLPFPWLKKNRLMLAYLRLKNITSINVMHTCSGHVKNYILKCIKNTYLNTLSEKYLNMNYYQNY